MRCATCGYEIREGQHFLKLSVTADTAGMETVSREPTVFADDVFDTPTCMVLKLMVDVEQPDSLYANVFASR